MSRSGLVTKFGNPYDEEKILARWRREAEGNGPDAAYARAALKFYDYNGRLPTLRDEEPSPVGRNPMQQRYLDLSKELSATPPGEDGMVRGPFVRVGAGTPVYILKAGPRKRILVQADYFGNMYYGWVDWKETVTGPAFERAHGYEPSTPERNPGSKSQRFDRCVDEVSRRGGVYDPGAVCAASVLHRGRNPEGDFYNYAVVQGTKKPGRNYIAHYNFESAHKSAYEGALNLRKTQTLWGNDGSGNMTKLETWTPDKAQREWERERGYRKNPQEGADALYESFHGKPPEETVEIETPVHEHEHLAGLGTMVSLKIDTESGYAVEVEFEDDPPLLCSSEDGRQLYFEGGTQELDLHRLHMDGHKWERDLMVIGTLTETTYRTQKAFDKFKTIDYFHANGEDTGVPPMLLYDPISCLMSVAGGQYEVKPEGIVN